MSRKKKKSANHMRVVPVVIVVVIVIFVIYSLTHKQGSATSKAGAVDDTTPPVIELVSNPDSYTMPNHAYVEEGYSAIDDVDGDITDRVVSYQGEGKVYYYVEDSAGNSTTVVREIVYSDTTPPEIVFTDGDEITIYASDTYFFDDPGYIAYDSVDGDLTDRVVISGHINPCAVGTYYLTYSVEDNYGNTAVAYRTVHVIDDGTCSTPDDTGYVIYLTFDDGPSQYTEELLDILDVYNVKVTFFTLGSSYPEIMADEVARGHAIAIHSATHDYSKIYSSEDAFFEDLEKQRETIYAATGVYTNLIRFPGGSSNTVSRKYCTGIMTKLTQSVTEQGYYYFDWDVVSGDAGDTTDTEEIYNNIISGIQSCAKSGNDAVILQHDTKKYSIDAVERVIRWAIQNGYSFDVLSEDGPEVHSKVNN